MPKELTDLKDFLVLMHGSKEKNIKPCESVTIKTEGSHTKFKLRCPGYMYTLVLNDKSKAEKIRSSIPSGIKKIDLSVKERKIASSK